MSTHRETADSNDFSVILEMLRGRLADEARAGGHRSLYSILRRVVAMSPTEHEELVSLYEGSCLASSAQSIAQQQCQGETTSAFQDDWTLGRLPFREEWLNSGGKPSSSIDWLWQNLVAVWSKPCWQNYRGWKYTRWIEGRKDASFILRIAFGLRMFYLTAPRCYFELDAHPEREYDPKPTPHDAYCWPWWGGGPNEVRTSKPQRVSKHAYLALSILDAEVSRRDPEELFNKSFSWWGHGDAALHSAMFDFDAFFSLVSFLLSSDPLLDAVLANVDGCVCRVHENLACEIFPEFSFEYTSPEELQVDLDDLRQLLPLYNFVHLVQHVENHWRDGVIPPLLPVMEDV